MGDILGGLLTIVTFLASIVTIIGGVATTLRFFQQLRPPQQQQAAVQQPVGVPQRAEPHSAAPAVPAMPPAAQPRSPAPPAQRAPALPGALPAASSDEKTASGRRRPISLLIIALAGLVAQVIDVTWLYLNGLTDSNGQWLGLTDPAVSEWLGALFILSFAIELGFLIYAVRKSVKLRRWGWFIEVVAGTILGFFALSGVALIIFGLFIPAHPRESRRGLAAGALNRP